MTPSTMPPAFDCHGETQVVATPDHKCVACNGPLQGVWFERHALKCCYGCRSTVERAMLAYARYASKNQYRPCAVSVEREPIHCETCGEWLRPKHTLVHSFKVGARLAFACSSACAWWLLSSDDSVDDTENECERLVRVWHAIELIGQRA